MARLDRLPAAKQVAQIGAVIGREFPIRCSPPRRRCRRRSLHKGSTSWSPPGSPSRRGAPPDAVYTFKHALTRDVAYASLLKSHRQICHRRIATALEEFDDGSRPCDGAGAAGVSFPGGRRSQLRPSPTGSLPAMWRSNTAQIRKPLRITNPRSN